MFLGRRDKGYLQWLSILKEFHYHLLFKISIKGKVTYLQMALDASQLENFYIVQTYVFGSSSVDLLICPNWNLKYHVIFVMLFFSTPKTSLKLRKR